MNDKVTTSKLWDNVINDTIKENSEEGYVSNNEDLTRAIKLKAKRIVKEFNFNLHGRPLDDKGIIKLKGDDVLINDKKVGTIKGTTFYGGDGSEYEMEGSEDEFMERLYDFLEKKYLTNESVTLFTKETTFSSDDANEAVLEHVSNDENLFCDALIHAENESSLTEWTEFSKKVVESIKGIDSDNDNYKVVVESYEKYESKDFIAIAKTLRENFKELV